VIGEIVMLLRRVLPRSAAAHQGGWDKSAADSHEVRGKTLGIVGYGNIGSQLSTLAEAMGMKVIFFDQTDKLRHGNTEPVESLEQLLARSDIVSLHVPETPSTHGMIGEAELRSMKRGAYLINNSRGTVVDLDALARAIGDEHLAGAAVDVFPGRAVIEFGSLSNSPAGDEQRHPHPSHRWFDGRGSGPDRYRSRPQDDRLL
jgi:Phosphoglycerate dehydrogenase and related dehydrogenases